LEGGGHRHFAEIALPGLLDGNRQVDPIAGLNVRAKCLRNPLFQGMKHVK
jgi:hypothetical protein